MIGHRSRFRENDHLPLWRGPAVKKKPPLYREKLSCQGLVYVNSINLRPKELAFKTSLKALCFHKFLLVQFLKFETARA